MKLYNVRGGSKEELENGNYNIGVGISLGNKWFTAGNILSLTKWALQYTKEYVVIYVADTIHAINIEVRNGKKYEKALEISRQKGNNILQEVKDEINNSFSSDEIIKIKYANWEGVTDEKYKAKVDYLYNLFLTDKKFRQEVVGIVRNGASKEERIFSEEQLERLAHYILEELPEVLNRVKIGKLSYDACVYPFDGELTKFVEQIQKAKVFPEIKKSIMDTKGKVFLEVRN